jgi:hypothetical protein
MIGRTLNFPLLPNEDVMFVNLLWIFSEVGKK